MMANMNLGISYTCIKYFYYLPYHEYCVPMILDTNYFKVDIKRKWFTVVYTDLHITVGISVSRNLCSE